MKINWHRQHKWSGIVAAVLLLVFCVSGVILNHRSLVADSDVSRRWLPSRYEYRNWNGGLLRGTMTHPDGRILIYGANGVWSTDSAADAVVDFNHGLPMAADRRQVRALATRGSDVFALTPEAIYILNKDKWLRLDADIEDNERLSDMAVRGDTLVVIGRSNLYVSTEASEPFRKIELPAAEGLDGKVTLFRTVWMLHSGELFGLAGKIVVDLIAVILVLLAITGLIIWLLPKDIRRRIREHKSSNGESKVLRFNMHTHLKVGSATIVLTMLIAITGWCLRPPVMIPLALTRTHPMPGTGLDSGNPWHDRLRMMRYDDAAGDWLISTSEGFFSLVGLEAAVPRKVESAPPVSVMGLNVWERGADGSWLCGSFSGMFRWDRQAGTVNDYFSGETVREVSGPPFGKYAAAGYSKEFGTLAEYYEGTPDIPQPDELSQLPMSLWGVALEAHSGRLFIGAIATYIFIFMAGLLVVWCIYSGWKARH